MMPAHMCGKSLEIPAVITSRPLAHQALPHMTHFMRHGQRHGCQCLVLVLGKPNGEDPRLVGGIRLLVLVARHMKDYIIRMRKSPGPERWCRAQKLIGSLKHFRGQMNCHGRPVDKLEWAQDSPPGMAGQDTIGKLHEAARAWVQAGFAVFPCVASEKRPASENGLKDATTDITQIDRWWSADPAFNIGVDPSRSAMFVVDQDGPLGAETLARLVAENGALPDTLTIQTPRGTDHKHFWFQGDAPSSVNGLGAKLDTRGRGGYVLVPPSSINGMEYSYASEAEDILPAPQWIADHLASRHDSHEARDGVEIDLPANLVRARTLLRDYVSAGNVAVEGQGGDSKTYEIACEILNLGLSPAIGFEVIRDEWNPHCIPPWELEELAVKVRNASEYAQNEPGAWAVPDQATLFAKIAAETPNVPVKLSKFYPRDESEQDVRPAPSWLIPNFLPDEGTVMLYGPSGTYKSFIALDICLALSSGIPAYGMGKRAPMETVYVAAEGTRGIERDRRPAWRLAHKIEQPLPFYTIDTSPMFASPGQVIELIEAIKKRGIAPKLIVIDTLARAMVGMNENDAKDAGLFIEAIELLKRELRCTVMCVHHTGKDEERGGRGSSALGAAWDTNIEIKTRTETKAVALWVRKQKDAEIAPVPWTFEGLPFGDSLAFMPTDSATHHRLTKGDDFFNPVKIGAALRELRAIGEPAGVTTAVLATHITPQIKDETTAERQIIVGRAAKQLGMLAKGKLQAYTAGEGRSLRWCLPAAVEEL